MSVLGAIIARPILRKRLLDQLELAAPIAKQVLNESLKRRFHEETLCVVSELVARHIGAEEGVSTSAIVTNGLFHLLKCLGVTERIRVGPFEVSLPSLVCRHYAAKVLSQLEKSGLTTEQGKSTTEIVAGIGDVLADVVF
jgi:hypothetical protein